MYRGLLVISGSEGASVLDFPPLRLRLPKPEHAFLEKEGSTVPRGSFESNELEPSETQDFIKFIQEFTKSERGIFIKILWYFIKSV